jgi:putative ABC transport system ATP-binding protein
VTEPVLQIQGVSREAADGTLIVNNVTFDVVRGEVIALVGPSGAGKSSLLRLLNRLDEPTSGTILLTGEDYRTLAPGDLRRRVGMVLQQAFLFPGTVRENIMWAPRGRGEVCPEDRVAHLLSRVQLPGYADRDVTTLSGGEAQRVSLARTLANSPEVLLLDEPTSALDELVKAEVEATLRRVFADRDLACVIVTHDEAQAYRLASRSIVLRDGRVVADGPTQEVLGATPLDR